MAGRYAKDAASSHLKSAAWSHRPFGCYSVLPQRSFSRLPTILANQRLQPIYSQRTAACDGEEETPLCPDAVVARGAVGESDAMEADGPRTLLFLIWSISRRLSDDINVPRVLLRLNSRRLSRRTESWMLVERQAVRSSDE